MKTGFQVLVGVLVAAAMGVVLWRIGSPPAPAPTSGASAPSPPAPVVTAPAATAEPAIKFPLEEPAAGAPLSADKVMAALVDLLGRKSVLSSLQVEDFPRRVVATVDNLARSHAPPVLWPVNPAPGRFTVEERDGGAIIAADNDRRYTPFVLVVESVDVPRAVDLYGRMYPLLQRAYEELGYPKSYFNDRLMAAIDLLLATPQVDYPVKLQLTEVKGPIASARPWVRYQFADPELESLAAGQKILMRVGSVNERRLKTKLAEFRSELATRSTKR
jgi:hypothetical protein